MAQLAALVRREALLRDFLIGARTERPLFRDDAVHRLAPDVEISATSVSVDFLGSAIIRARVRSLGNTPQVFTLIARIANREGAVASASAAVMLDAGAARSVELLCPRGVSPVSLEWSSVSF